MVLRTPQQSRTNHRRFIVFLTSLHRVYLGFFL
jgi:hypothetical protein